jgi:hypothetical protein
MLAALARFSLAVLAVLPAVGSSNAETVPSYAWLGQQPATVDTLAVRIPPPAGFERSALPRASFGAWLRSLPLKPAGAPVRLHTGVLKPRQDVHVAVIDIDVGTRDLQQCADAVMRLRAEWLFASGRSADIAFNDTGAGKPMAFSRWAAGERPRAVGNTLTWSAKAAPDAGYASFRRYMDTVFTWAGTHSLAMELAAKPVANLAAGDVFIKGGFPGHAVLVADIAQSRATGETRFLLVQSYMPAQDIHVLKNPRDPEGSPWYRLDFADVLETPEWTFARDSLRTWR